MITYFCVVIATGLIAAVGSIPSLTSVDRNTGQRISEYNYPVEAHQVHTEDGYILTVYRIPYSPTLQNKNEHRPVMFLHHGLLSSSDCWILNGPDNALAYLLADSGYDVWLGNARGNTYSKKHETLSIWQPSFWDFSWHEIALYDISASIDYILNTTNETGLHYVGHAMGTTVFIALMSLKPEYNEKIKTAHMLAPVVFTSHIRSPIAVPAAFIGQPSFITDLLSNIELLPHNSLVALTGSVACSEISPFEPECLNLILFIFGWDSKHFNTTVLSGFYETHPAGTSTNVYFHYLQEVNSESFRQYDYGPSKNLQKYKQESPPSYDVSKIVAPVRLYYADNDSVGDVTDVKKIEGLLPNVVESFRVPYPDWNHMDFLFANEVKETIFDRIINSANHFEATGNQ